MKTYEYKVKAKDKNGIIVAVALVKALNEERAGRHFLLDCPKCRDCEIIVEKKY